MIQYFIKNNYISPLLSDYYIIDAQSAKALVGRTDSSNDVHLANVRDDRSDLRVDRHTDAS